MPAGPGRGPIRFGVFELDPASGELSKRGKRIRLQDKPCQLLTALVERPGETITRKELQERLWPRGTFVEFENGLNNAVSRLREALGDTAESPRFIETLPRRGYRFVAPLEPAVADVPAPVVPPEPRPADAVVLSLDTTPSTKWRVRWHFVAGFALAVILLTVLAVTRRAPPAATGHSLVVLPFAVANAIDGSPDDYLAFGMTDALIGELSSIRALKVISQTSAMQYKGVRKTLPEIARELGATTVVEGSVVNEGGQVRLTVQLIDARTDSHLWTQTYSRDPATALSTQRALAREVAGLIRSRLVPSDRSTTPIFQQTNPAAYETYVRGRYFLQQPGEASMVKARGFFEQSIAADQNFAPAHVGLSNYFVLTDGVPPAEAMPKAMASARRALALDDSSAAAHASLAWVHYFGEWDWAAADRAFERALELDPNDARTRRWHALYLSSMGRHATAIEEAQRAIDLDPVSIGVFDTAAAVWSNARRFDKVLEQAERIRDLNRDDPRGVMHSAIGHLYQGSFADAVAWAQKGVEISGRDPSFLCVLAIAQHRAGQTQQAQQTLAEIDRLATTAYVPDVFLAGTYLWLRNHDAAVKQLHRAFERRDSYLVVANVAPWFDPLRGHPRFQDVLRSMKFLP
jgi:TolB-like protein/DNA-binding winged helix-turn-helix (wHTH) protein/tetratricopeptide (TPR) repeat protein